jgi:hypothetical protein
MDAPTFELIFGLGTVVCFFLCGWLYHVSRTAAWLAGATVAACVFCLGVTVAASFRVPGALALTPLWVGIGVLCGGHLYTAWRAAAHDAFVGGRKRPEGRATSAESLAGQDNISI